MLLRWTVATVLATSAHGWPWSSPSTPLKHEASSNEAKPPPHPDPHILEDMFTALHDMQNVYFERWVGTWPEGIDWTRAVMGTHIAATLRTLSDELDLEYSSKPPKCSVKKENVISGYFADLVAYYFAEDVFSIRNQAYDDMLWVVLGWLESIQLVKDQNKRLLMQDGTGGEDDVWYGQRWTPAFAHRARVFWELAAKGWDTKLCGGGMLWNPRLLPYKNAITNQLFIAASVSMFLHFPGDQNSSPFGAPGGTYLDRRANHNGEWPPHDPIFAKTAQNAHAWLTSSNMTNAQGLYADGFHISGYGSGSPNTNCDERDEMVYTYNQGVILSGLLGLFQATGNEAYLHEGHTLIQNVVKATGYDLTRDIPIDDDLERSHYHMGHLPPWRGLGRAGILEEACDVLGTCSQDGQTFKGIWMHHFATFCCPTSLETIHPSARLDETTLAQIRTTHAKQCARYVNWLRRNAAAALGTRDKNGLFGMWWTAGLFNRWDVSFAELGGTLTGDALPPDGGEGDYRNRGVPRNGVWMYQPGDDEALGLPPLRVEAIGQKPMGFGHLQKRQRSDRLEGGRERLGIAGAGKEREKRGRSVGDPNARGRGRTLETQGGGLAVLRALWVVSKHEL